MTETVINFNENNRTISQWLFNPFYYIAGIKALAIGVIIILITSYLAFLRDCRVDGLLVFYIRPFDDPLWVCISGSIMSWVLLSILLFISGKIISKSRIRIIDVFGTQALAQFPYLFIALAAMIPGMIQAYTRFYYSLFSGKGGWQLFSLDLSLDLIIFVSGFILQLVSATWMITLMYRAFVVSCNVTGRKAVMAFIISLLIGQTISMLVIYQLPTTL
jgi:hypothetical protein